MEVYDVRKKFTCQYHRKVRNQNNVITSKNCPELAKRIKELSKEFMVKNAELYKRLETR